MSLDRQKLDSQLILEEGLRLVAYKDPRGFLTTGVGRNLDGNPLTPAEIKVCGSDGRTQPITHDTAMFLLHNDEMKAMNALSAHASWWIGLDEIRSRVMVDLCFNMGWSTLSQFHHFLGDMSEGSFYFAAEDLMASAWYNEVGNRGPRLVGMVKTGEDYIS